MVDSSFLSTDSKLLSIISAPAAITPNTLCFCCDHFNDTTTLISWIILDFVPTTKKVDLSKLTFSPVFKWNCLRVFIMAYDYIQKKCPCHQHIVVLCELLCLI